MNWRAATIVTLLGVALAGVGSAESPDQPSADFERLWQKIAATELELDRAVEIRNLNLDTGMALFKIEEGVFIPAAPIGERSVEMMFQGKARLVLEPPDDIEAGQLELFTDKPRLDEAISEAAFVLTVDAASDSLLGRTAASGLDEAALGRAQEIFRDWKERPERSLLGVEAAIFRDALNDRMIQGYFAGWFRGEELGEFLYLVQPGSAEQVTLGRFTALEATEKEERKLSRMLHRQQRKGRLIGVSTANLGLWDTWLSTARRGEGGEAMPGRQAFEPKHYELELSLGDPPQLEMRGKVRLHLDVLAPGTRVVPLEMHSDLRVQRVTDAAGKELYFTQSRDVELDQMSEVLVVLPESPPAGEPLVLAVEYSGRLIDKVTGKGFALRNTTHWYPHAGTDDLATYDVTFEWPAKLDLACGGQRVDSGRSADGRRFERRRIDHPTFAYSFEVGKFQTWTGRAGEVDVTLAIDVTLAKLINKKSREELLATVVDSLTYFEETLGPYPLSELTVVTVDRGYSQSLFGFMTLASANMMDTSLFTVLVGLQDRRTVVAHEVAHQWWGHQVAWQSYRDQWISEAMANYSAMLYARHRLQGDGPVFIGPTSGWQAALTDFLEDGRTIESIGPLVLGERLLSSRSDSAYEAIVYKKGAIVVDMLSRAYGEEVFGEILRKMVAAVSFRQISTETFVDLIGRISGADLSGFAQQFIYGTGLPSVYYHYEFSKVGDGKWLVEGAARQRSPYRYRHEVIKRGDGGWDVARQRLDQTEVSDSKLVVPVQIAVFNPDGPKRDKKRGIDPQVTGNGTIKGRLALSGESSRFRFELDYEPKELWLDRDAQVFGQFYNEKRFPKRMLYYQGLALAGGGDLAAAESIYRQALAAEAFDGPSFGLTLKPKELARQSDRLDARVRLQLARLYLDQGRPADARATLEQLGKHSGGAGRNYLAPWVRNLEARLAIHSNDFERALKLLRKKLERGGTERLLLLAIAARETGNDNLYETAVTLAGSQGADASALEEVG
ncbi:MAG: M1 family aminopeptidase [Acidobacteriota bacterium]